MNRFPGFLAVERGAYWKLCLSSFRVHTTLSPASRENTRDIGVQNQNIRFFQKYHIFHAYTINNNVMYVYTYQLSRVMTVRVKRTFAEAFRICMGYFVGIPPLPWRERLPVRLLCAPTKHYVYTYVGLL